MFWTVCNYEHYIPLNLPLASAIGEMGFSHGDRSLAGMLLRELEVLMPLKDRMYVLAMECDSQKLPLQLAYISPLVASTFVYLFSCSLSLSPCIYLYV